MFIADGWEDFQLLDAGNGEKLERWGEYILRRPDPQVIWPSFKGDELWRKADAWYHRSRNGGGSWEYINRIPKQWTISYGELKFSIEPTGFKHTGLFPEQAVNWDWMTERIRRAGRSVNVLNLFAYTGGASVACAYAGAQVCHVDAAKGMVERAKQNLSLSGLEDRPVRFIVDDVFKFVQREIRRGRKYEAIIMDPPSYGRGPGGEVWKLEDKLYELLEFCVSLLSDAPLFFLINSYTTGLAPSVLKNMLVLTVRRRFGGTISCDEVGLPVVYSGIVLPCGASGRWEAG